MRVLHGRAHRAEQLQAIGEKVIGYAREAPDGLEAFIPKVYQVRGDNVPAQRVYLREGFERIAVRRGYYRTADGPADAWVMQRSIP